MSNNGILTGEQAQGIETDEAAEQELFERQLREEAKVLRTMLTQLVRLQRSRREGGGLVRSFRFLDGRDKRPDAVAVTLQVTPAVQIELVSRLITVPFRVDRKVVDTIQTFEGSFGLGMPAPCDREDFRQRVGIDALGEPEAAAALQGKIRLQDPETKKWKDYAYVCEDGDAAVHHLFDPAAGQFDGTASLPFMSMLQQARTYDPRNGASRSGGRRYSKYAAIGTRYAALPKAEEDDRDAWQANAMLIVVTPPHSQRRGPITETREFDLRDVKDGAVLGKHPLRLVYLPNTPILEWGGAMPVEMLLSIQVIASSLMSILCDGMVDEEVLAEKKVTVKADEQLVDRLKSLELWDDRLRGLFTRYLTQCQEIRDREIALEAALRTTTEELLERFKGSRKRRAAKATETPKPVRGAAAEATTDGANDDAFEPIDDLVEEAGATDGGDGAVVDEPEQQPVQGALASDDGAFEPVGDADDEIAQLDREIADDELSEREFRKEFPTDGDSADDAPFVETPKPAATPPNEQVFEPVDDSNFLQ